MNATATKKQINLLRQRNRNKVERIIRNGNFVRGTSIPKRKKGIKRRNLATLRVLQSCNDTGRFPL